MRPPFFAHSPLICGSFSMKRQMRRANSISALWAQVEPACRAMGVLPMEVLRPQEVLQPEVLQLVVLPEALQQEPAVQVVLLQVQHRRLCLAILY